MPRRQKRGKKKQQQQQQQPDPQPQVSPRPPSPQPGPSGLAPPAETNEAVVELQTSVEMRAPEAGAYSLAPGDLAISAELSLTIEEVERQCKDKRPADTAEQGQAAPKRPKLQEGPQQATESEGNIRSFPLNVSGVTCNEFLVDGRKKLLVKFGWTNASDATTQTENTNIKDAAVQTTDELQNIQMADSDVVEKEPEKNPEDDTPKDPKTDATIELVAPQAESAFSLTDGNSSNQMGTAVAVNDTPSLSVTGSSVVVKMEPEMDSLDDAVEDSKPLPGHQTECPICLTHGYSSSDLDVMDDIKPSLFDDDNIDVVEKEPEKDPEDDTPKDPKTDATIELVAPKAESAFSWTDGNSSSQMGAAVAVNDTPSLSVTGSSILVKMEPETDSFNDAVEDSKPLPGLQTECSLCLTHGYSSSHVEATDDIKPSLSGDDNIVVVKTEPEMDSLDDAVEDSKPLPGLQTECPVCLTHGYSSSHLEVTDDIKPSLFDDDYMPQEESNLQPTAQHTYGGRSEQGN